jgi:branched-chain amino acid transport system permease protein
MQILLNGLIVGAAYALVGIGFSMMYSTVRYFDLAYGMVAVYAAYITWSLTGMGVPFPLAVLMAALVSMLLGVLNYLLLYRYMVKRKSSPLVILVASFGMLIIYQNLAALFWGNSTKALSLTDTIQRGYEFLGLIITPTQLTIAGVAVVFMLLLEYFLQRTKYGMAIRAIGDNQELTKVLGLKVENVVIAVYMIGTFMSAVSASVIALEIGIRPTHGVFLVIKAFIASIIGGLGSMRGALVGGLILGVVENVGIYYIGGQWQDTIAFGLLTVFLIVKPSGLFGRRKLLNIT